jgi:hypothetical protein
MDLPKESKNVHVTNTCDSNFDKHAYIKGKENANRHETRHTKPTSQPTKTVGIDPTVTAGRQPAIKPTHADKNMLLPNVKVIQVEHTNNNNTTPQPQHTLAQETQQKTAQRQLAMSTPEQPSTSSGPNRRRAQRFKRGGHQTQLGSHARVNISQLLHRKGQTHAPPETGERSLAIGRFYDAPLHAKMLSPHVYPAIGQRGEIDNDCIYVLYPSRRLDL